MTSRRISGFDTTPTYVGEEPSVFTIKLHIGGDLVWHPTTGYKDGGVEYFDHFNCHEGSLLDLRRMVKQLRFCDKKVQFWVLVKGKGRKNSRKPELKPLINDADIVNLVGDVPPNKELDIFVEHLFDDQWDTMLILILGWTVMRYRKLIVNCLKRCLRSLENSDASDGELNVLENVFQESDLKKEGFKFVIGMIFKSADEFKWAVKYHEATRRKDIHFIKNEGRRVRVICRHSSICKWTIFASRSNPRSPFAVKTYYPEHTCWDQDENKTVNSGFLAKMYKDDIKLNTEWGRTQFQEHGTDMDEVIAGESDVGIEDQFEDIAVETQVPTFVLEEMELMNSQPSQVVLNQGLPMSSFIFSQMPTGSSNPSVITRSGKNYGIDKYNLKLQVEDANGNAKLKLVDKDCIQLIGRTASDLRAKHRRITPQLPKEIQSLVGLGMLFMVEVKREQLENRYAPFSVTKIINDQTLVSLYCPEVIKKKTIGILSQKKETLTC
nr:Zinc knuckle family protein [Ipomoea batatas]